MCGAQRLTVSKTVTGGRLLAVTAVGILGACRSDSATGVPAVDAIPVGQQFTVNGAPEMKLEGGASGADYLLVAYNASTIADTLLSATITGTGLRTAPSASLMVGASPTFGTPDVQGGGLTRGLAPDETFHARLAELARAEVPKRLAGTRAWFAARQPGAAVMSGGFRIAPSYSALPSTVAVGDVVRMNVNGNDFCTNPIYHGLRVKAIGTKSIVLADTLNPAGGFTDADYRRFATRFDTLVYPLDVENFGEPTDIDRNGRIAILFTRAVNELTPPNSRSYVGGFFDSRDLLAVAGSQRTGKPCPGSNEGEMFYMLVPDPTGAINGNVRRTGFVDTLTTAVLAHEFQHLINAGRRIYINTAAQDLEVVWLNEGLSHIAEELLYYRESGKTPRSNLTDADIRVNSRATYPFWKADASSNFARFIEYLQDPASNSPAADNDSLATRGATWSYLRYAVDQKGTDEAAIWRAFDNATTLGLTTIQVALGTDPLPLFRSWALANYLDDSGFTTDPLYSHKSWNFRDIYNNTYINLGFPLRVTALVENTSATVRVRGLSAAYYRVSVAAGQSARLAFSATGAAPNANLNFIAVRTR